MKPIFRSLPCPDSHGLPRVKKHQGERLLARLPRVHPTALFAGDLETAHDYPCMATGPLLACAVEEYDVSAFYSGDDTWKLSLPSACFGFSLVDIVSQASAWRDLAAWGEDIGVVRHETRWKTPCLIDGDIGYVFLKSKRDAEREAANLGGEDWEARPVEVMIPSDSLASFWSHDGAEFERELLCREMLAAFLLASGSHHCWSNCPDGLFWRKTPLVPARAGLDPRAFERKGCQIKRINSQLCAA